MSNSPNQPTKCIQRMLEEGLTQEYVAFMIGKAQQTVNHYLNPNDQQDLPAYAIPFLPEPLAVELLRFLADRIGHDVLRKIPIKGICNGSTDDEMLNLEQGKGFRFRRRDLIEWREKFRTVHESKRRRVA